MGPISARQRPSLSRLHAELCPLLLLLLLLAAPVVCRGKSCHRYRGMIEGAALGPLIQVNTTDQCEELCEQKQPACYGYTFTPASTAAGGAGLGDDAPAAPKCMVYNQSNIGGGANLPGTPTAEPDAATCCSLCSANLECESWTWACETWPCPPGKSAPCWLHPAHHGGAKPSHHPTWVSGVQHAHTASVGANCQLKSAPDLPGVNSGTGQSSAICGIDDARFDNPLELLNSTGDFSGVPMGGVGVGFVDLAPDGQIKRVAINNAHQNGVLTDTKAGSFLALWEGKGTARVLQRPAASGPAGAAGLGSLEGARTNFSGLFPIATLDSSEVEVSAWSPLVPQQIENSSLPLVYFDVTVRNHGRAPKEVAVAFSWQDVIARNLFDATTAQLDAYFPTGKGPATCSLDVNSLMQKCGNDCVLARPPTLASPLSVAGAKLEGVEQHLPNHGPLKPNKLTMQQYNDRVAIMVQKSGGAADSVSLLKSYAVGTGSGDASAAAVAAWQAWSENGRFPAEIPAATQAGGDSSPLYTPTRSDSSSSSSSAGEEMASVVSLRTTIAGESSRAVHFILAWHAQEVSKSGRAAKDNRTVCGTTDNNRMYHNRFAGKTGLEQLLGFAGNNTVRAELRAGTKEWHDPILASTMPKFLQFKLINSAYTMVTNALLNKGGYFSAMEGGMGGLAGTMDQRIAAHSFYFKFFPQTDTLELAQFGAAHVTDCAHPQNLPHCTDHSNVNHGAITHFDANIYGSICGTSPDSVTTANGEYEDNTYGWLYQLAKSYVITGNLSAVLEQKDSIPGAIAHVASKISPASEFVIPGPASNTYDDFWELPIDTYVASMYPMVMHASAILATALGNSTLAKACTMNATLGGQDFVRSLYHSSNSSAHGHGGSFAYGCQLNGSGRRDDIMFSGMLAGQMLSRHAGWGDLPGVPFAKFAAAMRSQLVTHVAESYNFYPPKVYNLTSHSSAIDPRNGDEASTWPFYLESYTAAAAIQAGYLEDGLEVIKHIGLVNLRLGLNWAQSLWNPGFLTYVTAPVTWFVPDVLASAGLDRGAQTLFLAPTLALGEQRVVLPLFFPSFWATVTAEQAAGDTAAAAAAAAGTIRMKVTKVFGAPTTIKQVTAQPVGTASAAGHTMVLPQLFECREGAVLNLDAGWEWMVGAAQLHERVLPAAPPGGGT